MAAVLNAGTERILEAFRSIEEDPIHAVIKFLTAVGLIGVGIGAVMAVVGYFLKSSSGAAAADAASTLQKIGGVFGNVSFSTASTTLSPVTGNGAMADLDNFVSDIENVLQSTWSDITGGVSAIATTISDIPKALFVGLTSLPHLTWDFLVWAGGGAVADVANYVYPYLVVGGFIALAAAFVLSYFNKYVRPVFSEKWAAWSKKNVTDKIGSVLDKVFRLESEVPEPPPDHERPIRPRTRGESEMINISEPALPDTPEEVYAEDAWRGYGARA
jgi:hypothetical protein